MGLGILRVVELQVESWSCELLKLGVASSELLVGKYNVEVKLGVSLYTCNTINPLL